jgi:hypothetical protein
MLSPLGASITLKIAPQLQGIALVFENPVVNVIDR